MKSTTTLPISPLPNIQMGHLLILTHDIYVRLEVSQVLCITYKWLGNGFARDFILVPACLSLGSLIFCGGMLALMKDFKPIANPLKKWGINPTTPHGASNPLPASSSV
jgi:hypothetical protein